MNATTKTVITLASLASNFALGTAALRLNSHTNAGSAATIASRITALERQVAEANATIAAYDTAEVVAAAEAEHTNEFWEIAGWLQNGVGESEAGLTVAAILAQQSFEKRDRTIRAAGVAAADAEHTEEMEELMRLARDSKNTTATTMMAILAQQSMDERNRKTRAWWAENSRLDAAKAQLQVLRAQQLKLLPKNFDVLASNDESPEKKRQKKEEPLISEEKVNKAKSLLEDPEIQAMIKQIGPKAQAAVQNLLKNPLAVMQYMDDPELSPLVSLAMGKFMGGGRGGAGNLRL